MSEHRTKTTLVFLPADGEASWLLFPSSVSLLSFGTVQPKHTDIRILKVTERKPKEDNHEHESQLAPAFIPLSQSQLTNNKFRFSFNPPNRWDVKLVDVKHVPHKSFLL